MILGLYYYIGIICLLALHIMSRIGVVSPPELDDIIDDDNNLVVREYWPFSARIGRGEDLFVWKHYHRYKYYTYKITKDEDGNETKRKLERTSTYNYCIHCKMEKGGTDSRWNHLLVCPEMGAEEKRRLIVFSSF